jgi:uncharacterized protein (DUF58 family)
VLLEPAFLEKLERLRLVARRRTRGSAGERRSRTLGRGVEFSDHRAYQVGDDWRYVDWSIYARLDRLFVKLFEEEEDTDVHLLVDASGSMAVGSPPKLEYAKRLAAALGYVGLAGGDRVGAVALHGTQLTSCRRGGAGHTRTTSSGSSSPSGPRAPRGWRKRCAPSPHATVGWWWLPATC